MKGVSAIEESAIQLLETVQAGWEEDILFSAWLGAEGERVRDNALALVRAAESHTIRSLLAGATVHEFLGLSWLEVHYKCYERADVLQALVADANAA